MNVNKSALPASFSWNAETPPAIDSALTAVSPWFPALKKSGGEGVLKFVPSSDTEHCSVKQDESGAYVIRYGQVNMALRMVGNLLSGNVPEEPEYCPFRMFGIMLDCSRDAVMNTEHRKEYFAHLALLGYNMIMLYTEDTYQIADEPYFGFMRGALTESEIMETDKFCELLGMEMIPCIQTLGHLAQMLRWKAFTSVRDTGDILLADEPKTYELIEKMLLTWKGKIRSKRIHIGMDEAHGIGRGRFFDLHGDQPQVEIFNRHLAKVMELCVKHEFQPMIWSDMYFRLGSKTHDYYDKDCVITKEVVDMIPKNVELVYWDYYHDNKEFYTDWIQRHRAIAGEPLMGSGVWTWSLFWYGRGITEKTVVPCLEACRDSKVRDVFFTMWGDDGGYCDFDSAMAGLTFSSDLAFTGKTDNALLNAKLAALFDGASYDAVLTASEIADAHPQMIFWDDPIMMMMLGSRKYNSPDFIKKGIETLYRVVRTLKKAPKTGTAGDISHALALADAAMAKLIMVDALLDAYDMPDLDTRRDAIADAMRFVNAYARKFNLFMKSFRAMWMRHNKPFGLETMQLRFAGQAERVKELKLRLQAFLDGQVDVIPEFDEVKRPKEEVNAGGYTGISHGSLIV